MKVTDLAKTELADSGEEVDEYVNSVSKLRQSLIDLAGVDIMINDSTFKSTYQILQEITEALNSTEKKISDIDKANIIEIMFGKQRANIGASIIQSFSEVDKALDASQNASGSAMKEHSNWMKSIEASEAQASAAFEEFSSKVLSSDLIKMGYDAETGILGFLTNIIDTLGVIPTLASAAAAALSFKDIGISKVNMPYPTF